MRVALVGARGHGARHVENLLRLGHDGVATFVGVVDVADVGDVPVPSYPDLPSLAAELHPEVVLISSPPSTHRDLVLDAFELGCDVLVEKPALLSVADYEEIAAAAVKRGLVCQVGFQSQGTGSYRRLCSLIGSGALLYGYFSDALRWKPQAVSPEVVRFLRKEQHGKLKRMLRLGSV